MPKILILTNWRFLEKMKIIFLRLVDFECNYCFLKGTATECGLHVCCRGEANGTVRGPLGVMFHLAGTPD